MDGSEYHVGMFDNQSVLVTGGTGSFGQKLVETLLASDPPQRLIPTMNILDLARAVAPGCRVETVGIRPGEKLHETMISGSYNPVGYASA